MPGSKIKKGPSSKTGVNGKDTFTCKNKGIVTTIKKGGTEVTKCNIRPKNNVCPNGHHTCIRA